MATEVTMPKLAMTQETGVILQWYKREGDPITSGEPLLEVMTNKVNIDVESYNDGILLKRLYEAGDEVPVLETIAFIGEKGEEVSTSYKSQTPIAPSSSEPTPVQSEQLPNIQFAADETKIRATPAARAVARARGVNLHNVPGSGANGRIHKGDVLAFTEHRTADTATSPAERREQKKQSQVPAKVTSRTEVTSAPDHLSTGVVVPLSGMRRVIGQRMAQSAYTAPHVTLTLEVDMLATSELRKQMIPLLEERVGARLSVNVMILKAVASVLLQHPNVNATWHGDNELFQHKTVHLGMAVAVPNGLLVPVVRDADRMGLGELLTASKNLAEGARTQTLSPDTLHGGTFTVSNLGMYGIEEFTPIINSPQVAILGVGNIIEKPVAVNGQVEIRPQMKLSLSFDHRALDGSEAALFLRDLRQVLENPILLLA